nr:hypothetical protein KitaXyl93_27280 [Kitasatospora sp. Xyl93]
MPDSRSLRRNSSAPGIGVPSWMRTPSMSVSQDSMGLRSATCVSPEVLQRLAKYEGPDAAQPNPPGCPGTGRPVHRDTGTGTGTRPLAPAPAVARSHRPHRAAAVPSKPGATGCLVIE